MKHLVGLLFVSLLADLWLSIRSAQCQNNLGKDGLTTSFCCDTSSGKTCLKTFHAGISRPDTVRRPFEEASRWCKVQDPGSSLVFIVSIETQRIVESFIGRQVLANETIVMDATKLSARNSLKWSWVNGHPTVPINVRTEEIHDGACVESKHGQSLTYCTGYVKSQFRYICEYSDSRSAFSHRHNSKSFVASEVAATWYDAREECLRLGGDLASIMDLRTIGNWSRMTEKQTHKYWIGLHRNKWIWNSTGAAVTYTKWYGGYPDDSSDTRCICISPHCSRINEGTMLICQAKWWTCNCNNNYAVVCQTEIVATEEMLPSTSPVVKSSAFFPRINPAIGSTPPAIATTTSTNNPIATTPKKTKSSTTSKPVMSSVTTCTTTIADNSAGVMDGKTVSASSMTQKLSNHFAENQTPAFVSSSTGLFKSFTITEIFLILFLFVTVVFIFFAVIVLTRKCKPSGRNEESPKKKAKPKKSVSHQYETMVRDNRPEDDIVPIYTELELTQHPTFSNSTIYAQLQPTVEAVDMDINVIYVDPHDV